MAQKRKKTSSSKRRTQRAAPEKSAKRAKPPRSIPKKSGKRAEPVTREPIAARETPLDPRVAAAIALALRDEAAAQARARTLEAPISAWALSGRVRRG